MPDPVPWNVVAEAEPGRCTATNGVHAWRIQPALLDPDPSYRLCAACGREEYLP